MPCFLQSRLAEIRADSYIVGRPLPGCVPPPVRKQLSNSSNWLRGPEIEHLAPVMLQVKSCADADIIFALPVIGRNHFSTSICCLISFNSVLF